MITNFCHIQQPIYDPRLSAHFVLVYQYQGQIVNRQTGLTKIILTLRELLYPLKQGLNKLLCMSVCWWYSIPLARYWNSSIYAFSVRG